MTHRKRVLLVLSLTGLGLGLVAAGVLVAGPPEPRGANEPVDERHIDAVTDFRRGGRGDLLLEERASGGGQEPDRTWLVLVNLWSGQVGAFQRIDGQRLLGPVYDMVFLRTPTGLVTRSLETLALTRDEAAWRSKVPELAALTPDSRDCFEPDTAEFRFAASDGGALALSLLDDSVKPATSTSCEPKEATARVLDIGARQALSIASVPGSSLEQVVGVGDTAITGYDLRYLTCSEPAGRGSTFLLRSTSPAEDAWTELVRLDVDATNQLLTLAPTWTTKLFRRRSDIKRAAIQFDKDYGGCKACEGFRVRQTLIVGDGAGVIVLNAGTGEVLWQRGP